MESRIDLQFDPARFEAAMRQTQEAMVRLAEQLRPAFLEIQALLERFKQTPEGRRCYALTLREERRQEWRRRHPGRMRRKTRLSGGVL